jgi:hypothetical protein
VAGRADQGPGAVRLFAAVWPPDSVLAALAGTSLPPASGLRWTPPERWHVTLAFYGEVPTHEVSDLTAALADGVGAVRTAPVAYLGDRTCRLGHHVLAAPVATSRWPVPGANRGSRTHWSTTRSSPTETTRSSPTDRCRSGGWAGR